MRIQGQIEEGVLVNLLQYLNLNSATGVLRLQSPRGVSGAIFTSTGQVVHAETQALRACRRSWRCSLEAGRFAFQSAIKAPRRTVDKPLDALLLEVAYQTDHAVDPGAVQLGPDTVLAPVSLPASQQGKRVALPLVAIRMLPHLNGVTPLGTVAANLGVTMDELLSAANILVENDLASISEGRMLEEDLFITSPDLVRDIMGPLADIVMDESLDELGATASSVPEAQLPNLLELLAQEFPGQLRATFQGRVEALLRAHGLRPNC